CGTDSRKNLCGLVDPRYELPVVEYTVNWIDVDVFNLLEQVLHRVVNMGLFAFFFMTPGALSGDWLQISASASIIWSKGNTLPLLVGVQIGTAHFGNQYSGFSENWESIYIKTPLYHTWAYTQGILNHKGCMLYYVDSSIIHNNQNLENNLDDPQLKN
ncbi:hypothetical protein STEG23_028772, partial [Scotinomys teguina]